MELTVLNRQRRRQISTRAISGFLRRLVRELPAAADDQLAVCFVSDIRMMTYNRDYRGRKETTDVLSFPGDDATLPEGGRHLGDIVISVPQAARQARDLGHGLSREIKVLLIHGYLHLLGYDHERDDGTMLRLQRRLTRRLLVPPRKRSA